MKSYYGIFMESHCIVNPYEELPLNGSKMRKSIYLLFVIQ